MGSFRNWLGQNMPRTTQALQRVADRHPDKLGGLSNWLGQEPQQKPNMLLRSVHQTLLKHADHPEIAKIVQNKAELSEFLMTIQPALQQMDEIEREELVKSPEGMGNLLTKMFNIYAGKKNINSTMMRPKRRYGNPDDFFSKLDL